MSENNAQATHAQLRAVTLLVLALTLLRLGVLFGSPLDLYPDEAQYWLWSRTLDFGYYSKPPMIAWAIWATTSIGGDAEAWVRLSAPFFQAGATLAVFAIGARLYDKTSGLVAAALYALMPGIQLSATVAATDAPLLFFLSLATLAYVALQDAEGRRRLWLAVGLGAALGLAFLSKYAAAYFLIGVALDLALRPEARRPWTWRTAAAAVGATLAILSPNLIWNAAHGFSTLHHTAANAAWGGRQLFNVGELADFIASQFGVFGPIPMGALVVGLGLAIARRRLSDRDQLLLAFTLPPLLLVSAQAFVSRANANWSGAAYLTGAVLVAAWLVRWRARRWLLAALAIQTVLALAFYAFVLRPDWADRAGAANAFKRAKGWEETTQLVLERAAREDGLEAIAVNNRFLFYSLAYYGREAFASGAPPLRSWLLMEDPQNQAETVAPLTETGRVLLVSYEGWRRAEMQADFARTENLEIVSTRLDRKRRRRLEMFVGEGFAPRPRDPVTGLPTPPS